MSYWVGVAVKKRLVLILCANNFLFPLDDAVQRALYCDYKALVLLLQGVCSGATRLL